MRALALCLTLLAFILPATVLAQEEDDRTRIVRFLEDQLSDGARTVTISGFRGALSSTAQMDLMTIADDDGVWLTLENVQLTWSRAALLRGALQIDQLTAEHLEIARRPTITRSGPDLSSAEATPFSLPELPVSIAIERTAIARVSLGEDILGLAVAFSIEGNARLAGGEGSANLNLERIDGPRGLFDLQASYGNTTRQLDLALLVEEEAGGIATTLLGLPGAPPVRLSVDGAGPIDEFTADIALESDGEPRLTGQVVTSLAADTGERRVQADLGGDITPLLMPDYRRFFGPDVALETDLRLLPDGSVELDTLSLGSAALTLDGTLSLAPGGHPRAFELVGRIADPEDEGPVRLPVSGGDVTVGAVDLNLSYDSADRDSYTAKVGVTSLNLGPARVASLSLDASGQIGETPQGLSVSSPVTIEIGGLSHDDPALATALGDSARLTAQISWLQGAPLILSDLETQAGNLFLSGMAALLLADQQLTLTTDLRAEAGDLSRFAALTGQPLAGSLSGALSGEAEILSGAFDMVLTGTGTDLVLADGVPPELLAGDTTLTVSALRDATGTTLRELRLSGQEVSLTANGRLSSTGATLSAEARLAEVGLFTDALSGPANVTIDITQGVEDDATLQIAANLRSDAGINADLTGGADPVSGDFDLTLSGTATDLPLPAALPPQLSAGEIRLFVSARRDDGVLILRDLRLAGPELTLTGSGQLSDAGAVASAEVRLNNIGLFTDALSGAVTSTLNVTRGPDSAAPYRIVANVGSAAGITATLSGSAEPVAGTVDLTANGQLPLALANRALAPRGISGSLAFDLTLRGAPSLANLSGSFRTGGARVTLPIVQTSIDGLSASGQISGGRLSFDANGTLGTGGTIGANGSVTLTTPGLPAQITVTGQSLRLIDPTLYSASINRADVTVSGSLAGSLQVGGTIALGETELRIPESGLGGSAPIPPITHLGETAAERRTRVAAGLGPSETGSGGSQRIGLDLTITAPGRIFLRGRGLDAELGGTLGLAGTTANVIPSGRFDLIRGRLAILGNRLDLTDGSATLQGNFDPYIRLLATSRNGGYTIGVNMIGRISAPEISFTSTPALPEDEVLAQLLFGRSVSALSPVQLLQMADAAASLAGGSSQSGIFATLREGLGLDDLDLQTDAEGNAALRAGRYLSDNVYTDVVIDQDGNTGASLNIDLTPDITARGTFSTDGTSRLGVFFERDY
ncbi:translocation/assembly module TamB domain-containing protein [Roseicyclus mahoneyensis]|uniref:Autotransporter secretion inner membrane protein TamB n=1 Tax=Roseicyclus mahoneyensis TaxID=164332 RepID=A0A316GKI8_9RHOB|nr:translocation/assembly module TamB domain-containing protein [Roseicyclus mahoneyensis]PWK61618.1 autotransporter secretion inner membrane protein TamB [Roseicyclus mahoneyensis]